MFEYKFVKISLERGWWIRRPSQDYRAVVREHASQGWRLVQIFAPAIFGYGKAVFFELIFERPRE